MHLHESAQSGSVIGERERANLVVRSSGIFYIIGERERANLVVRSSGIFCLLASGSEPT